MFEPFPKMARLSREVIVTEKIDGSNAQIIIFPRGCVSMEQGPSADPLTEVDGNLIYAGSRTRLITPGKSTDNFGFAAWVHENAPALVRLGPGRHFGEWYGKGIQRGYGLDEKRFMLFNTTRWGEPDTRQYLNEVFGGRVEVATVIEQGPFDTTKINNLVEEMRQYGSYHVKGFHPAEGVVVYHTQAHWNLKVTTEKDEQPKGVSNA